MSVRRLSNVVGFDDAPFAHRHRGAVAVVGTVFAGPRLDGVLVGRVHRDGDDAAQELARLVAASRFRSHVQLIFLQGIALAGFNVVDLQDLHRRLELPILVVARREPDLPAIRDALLRRVPEGQRKWELIEAAGPMERIRNVYVQRVGLAAEDADQVLARFAVHGHVPEPLRVAHLIAGALAHGQSRGRA